MASVLGVDPLTDFWSTPLRMTGLLLYLHLAGLFVVMTVMLQTARVWILFFVTNILTGLAVSVLHFFPSLIGTILAKANSGSTLGNSSVFGTYLLFLIAFGVMLFVWKSVNNKIKLFGLSSALIFTITLFSTDANAAQIALVGGFVLWTILYLIKHPTHRLRAWINGVLIALLVVSALAVGVLIFVPNTQVHNGFVSIGGPTRFILWDIAWQGIKERPFLGWGLEQFSHVFLRYYNSCLGSASCGTGAWADRAHNIILDTTISSGLIGLLAYLLIFVVTIKALWKKQSTNAENRKIGITLIALLVAYFVQNLTGFDSTVSLFLWVVVLAFCHWFTSSGHAEKAPPQQHPIAFMIGSGILFMFGITFFVARPAIGFLGPSASSKAASVEDRLVAYNRAVNISPAGLDYRRSFMAFETSATLWYASTGTLKQSSEAARQEISMAQSALLNTMARRPNDLRAQLMLARLYQVESRLFRPTAIDDAKKTLMKANDLNPRNPQPLWALTSVLLEQNDIEQALTAVKSAFDLNPDDPKAHIARLTATVFTGDKEQIKKNTDESSTLFPHLSETLQSIASADPIAHRLQLLTIFY